jgi:hypothetical protein
MDLMVARSMKSTIDIAFITKDVSISTAWLSNDMKLDINIIKIRKHVIMCYTGF